ncbi:PAS domain-containing protein [Candidatus Saccharibacteria bacterium]|nr:PAS domain-containing protein [Candidatus Saccharibacteria bacterium]
MGIFQKKTAGVPPDLSRDQAILAEKVLNTINDGVVIIDQNGLVKLINPAATRMTGNSSPADVIGLSYLTLIRLENGEGLAITDNQNPLIVAVANNTAWESRDYFLVTLQGEKIPIALSLTPSGGRNADRIITMRNITQELQKEGEQTEFISTASHEMRTPVASIEGYLGLALNPQTATIDDRARQYLTEAHNASQHLGKLFRDLLDVTKLDDKREKLHLVPVDMMATVKDIADHQMTTINDKEIKYSFGAASDDMGGKIDLEQAVYAMVDIDFLQEILGNLLENAVKYTEPGGAVWVSVRGDGDNVLINVTDTGMGISPDNLTHIFQKFYRVDNSQTRTIGGTGLGLYIVKERTEAMGGKVWAESAFGEGSTFYVSLPRLTPEEYERQKMVIRNTEMMPTSAPKAPAGMAAATMAAAVPLAAPTAPVATPVAPVTTSAAPATTPVTTATETQPQPAPAPAQQPVQSQPETQPTADVSNMSPEQLAAAKQQFAAQTSQNSTSVIQ